MTNDSKHTPGWCINTGLTHPAIKPGEVEIVDGDMYVCTVHAQLSPAVDESGYEPDDAKTQQYAALIVGAPKMQARIVDLEAQAITDEGERGELKARIAELEGDNEWLKEKDKNNVLAYSEENKILTAQVRWLRGVLLSVEYGAWDRAGETECCPICEGWEDKHEEDCSLRAALDETGKDGE